ncbi:MAG: selenocysteine-specific translation elongation factor [Nitrospiraceae bacterium]|nr:selenocysteine-specific translation elongation factor [Nitrospiraceae bacterium]
MRHIILGTAGHIDHGKSTLVKALTGVDPDRLKEEKERGITIDIGFADLSFPDKDLTVGIVDVPGHERLIRNMLAGAGGIDMVLLVIAADEGIMPQSREHLAICNLLRIKSGIIAVTKSDLVDPEWLELVQDDIRNFVRGTFLEGAPLVSVSSRTGEGIERLGNEIQRLGLTVAPKPSGGLFRLPIDRVFTLKGFGTVVTGTAISGSIALDEPIEILPAGVRTKVRGLHSHGRSISRGYAGQRVAINLQAVEKEALNRGDVAVSPSIFSTTRIIDAYIQLLEGAPDLKSRSLVHFYSGTSEVIARIILFEKDVLNGSEECYCQFRLQEPVVVMAGDRYIVRRFSPLETLGGGNILDPAPGKRKRKDGTTDLVRLHTGGLAEKLAIKIEHSGIRGITPAALHAWINEETVVIDKTVDQMVSSGIVFRYAGRLIHRILYQALLEKIMALLREFHEKNPLKPGPQKEEVRATFSIEPELFAFMLDHTKEIVMEKNLLRLNNFRVALTGREEEHSSKILELLNRNSFQPPTREELMAELALDQKKINDIINLLAREKKVVRINDSICVSGKAYDDLITLLKSFFSGKNEMTVAEFRDLLNTTRKYALPFLEYLDAHRITLRVGDARKFILKT